MAEWRHYWNDYKQPQLPVVKGDPCYPSGRHYINIFAGDNVFHAPLPMERIVAGILLQDLMLLEKASHNTVRLQ